MQIRRVSRPVVGALFAGWALLGRAALGDPAAGTVPQANATPQANTAPQAASPVPASTPDPTEPTTGLTLKQCLDDAMKNPKNVERWELTVDEARQHATIVHNALNPEVAGSASGTFSSLPDVTVQQEQDALIGEERAEATINLTYVITDFGKRAYDAQAASEAVALARMNVTGDQLQLLQATSADYYAVLFAQRALDSNKQQVIAAQKSLDDTEERFNVGTVTRADILTAETTLDTAEANVETYDSQLATSYAALAKQIGLDPTEPVELAPAPPPDWVTGDDQETLVERASGISPDRLRLEQERQIATTQLSSIKVSTKPVFELNAEFGQAYYRDVVPPYSYIYAPFAAITASLTMPLLKQSSLRAAERAQKDAISLLDTDLRQTTQEIRDNLTLAIKVYKDAESKVTIEKNAFDTASESYRLAQERYNIGKATEESVVQQLQLMAEARDLYEQALDQRDTAAQSLRWLTGVDTVGQYAPTLPVDVPGKHKRNYLWPIKFRQSHG